MTGNDAVCKDCATKVDATVTSTVSTDIVPPDAASCTITCTIRTSVLRTGRSSIYYVISKHYQS